MSKPTRLECRTRYQAQDSHVRCLILCVIEHSGFLKRSACPDQKNPAVVNARPVCNAAQTMDIFCGLPFRFFLSCVTLTRPAPARNLPPVLACIQRKPSLIQALKEHLCANQSSISHYASPFHRAMCVIEQTAWGYAPKLQSGLRYHMQPAADSYNQPAFRWILNSAPFF